MTDHAALRILDAALNRAGEGLRVVEDYVRFVLDDAHLTEMAKQLRHDLATAGARLPLADRHTSRDTQADVGTAISTPSEGRRADAWEVCVASFERAKQSLRSLEEFGKVAKPQAAAQFEALRYRLYTLEAAVGRTVDAVARLTDVRLYVLVDGGESEAEFARLVEELSTAGVNAIQLRDKRLSDGELISRGRLLVRLTRKPPTSPEQVGQDEADPRRRTWSGLPPTGSSQCLAIINDRPDIAAAVGADGVQLGQDDMSVKDARATAGPRMLIGVSTHSIEQAREAVLAGANYIGVGPTFPSTTKSFDVFPGVELLRQVAAEIRLPAFAIGGISPGNAAEVLAAGFTRLAVSSAIVGAASPAEAVRQFKAVLATGG